MQSIREKGWRIATLEKYLWPNFRAIGAYQLNFRGALLPDNFLTSPVERFSLRRI
jgi:hypothetical protein